MPRKRVKRTIGVKKTKLQFLNKSKLGKTVRGAATPKITAVNSDELLNVDSELSENEMSEIVDDVSLETSSTAVVDMELDPDIHSDGVAAAAAAVEDTENGNDPDDTCPKPTDSEPNLNSDETVNENLCEENAENITENKDENVNVESSNEIDAIESNETAIVASEKNVEESTSVCDRETAMDGAENKLLQGDTIYEVTEIDTVEILDVDDDNENVTKNTNSESTAVDTKTDIELDRSRDEHGPQPEPELVDIVDSNEENGTDSNHETAATATATATTTTTTTTNPIADAIVREEIDLNLDSADLEILDERVERSINAEIEKENQMVQEAKNSKVSKENSGKESLTSSTISAAAGDKKKMESRRNLWVCNIPSSTRANDLKQTFAKYGKVVGAKIVVNTRSPGSKYYGYVTMDTEKDANNCIKFLNNSNFNGQKITIEKVNSEKDVTLNNGGGRAGGNGSKSNVSPSPSSGAATKSRDKSYEKNNCGSGGGGSSSSSVGNVRTTANNGSSSSGNGDQAKRDVSRTRSTSKSTSASASMQRELDREKQRLKEKWRAEFHAEMTRERDRISRLEERLRSDMDSRQKHMERRMRDEERRLEREREELRKEREKLEKEKNELWRMEREKARQEREKLEREREELKRQKKLIEEENSRSLKRSAPSPPQIRNTGHGSKDAMRRDLMDDMVAQPPSKRRYDPTPMPDNYDRVAPSTPLSSMSHKDDRLPKVIDTPSSYNKYDSEAAMYLARIERENRSGPKDLRYTLMESASYRNVPLEPPAPPTNLDRKSRDHSHRYLDDSPKEHMSTSRSAYDRPVRTTSPLNKFHSQSSAPPPHWNNSRSMNNTASNSGGGNIGSGIPSSSDPMRWNQVSASVGNNCRIGGGSSTSSASQSIYPNASNMSRQHQNPMAMHQQQQQQQPQSPWSNSQAPSTADYNIHGGLSSNNTYPMSSYDNYKSPMNRNKY